MFFIRRSLNGEAWEAGAQRGESMRHHKYRTGSVFSGLVVAALLMSCLALVTSREARSGEEEDRLNRPLTIAPPFGAFLDSDVRGVYEIRGLERWLNGAEIRVGHTYLPGNNWTDIEGQVDFLDDWAVWRRARADRMLVLNVPMQEHGESHVADQRVRQLLQAGAAGQFDRHFKVLAEKLVTLKVPDTVIVLGWEMNGSTYTHRCGPNPGAWKAYWRRVVAAMRSVKGQKFRFDFAPSRGHDAVPWTACYPGDEVVDVIGMDTYDQPTGQTFDSQVNEPLGLQQQIDFAETHHKSISYPEWGLFQNGDNPEYMRRMLEWIHLHPPLYNTITDYCPHGVWRCGKNPKASQVYRSTLLACTRSELSISSRMPKVQVAPSRTVQVPRPSPQARPTHASEASPLGARHVRTTRCSPSAP
ncbi:glycoside hydrolase family 26 protein [Streptomyces violascens]|uniref:glycoside hydrolase family 26 protein n=1 Tax=Streptomyces violascens TaxID=67381 RepID=UPI003690B5E9